jgi:DNA-binding NarL/FixJ family response regulator
MIRVLIADDQKVIRDGVATILSLLPEFEVVGTAIDGDDAVRQTLNTRPDVVLMDLSMPGCDGVTATRRILEAEPGVRIIALTTYSDDQWVFAALTAGARGYLTKDAGADEIRQAIVTVAAGEALLDPSVQRRLLEALASNTTRPPTTLDPPAANESPDGLTARELEVLAEIAAGRSNPEIANALYISEATVKTHVNHLLAKTGLRDRAQLVGYAFRNGLTSHR